MKEEILRQSYNNPIEYKGGKVIIMKELPEQVVLQRKKLVSFVFQDRRFVIKTEEDMDKLLSDNGKFLEN